ncbi:MAG: sulfite reductase, dissimilatory-type subunit alpha [Nitrospirae bacterium]|nr:sulfite reductase, dissimilatory-type subunit alpha [Nitrospirota bacterium]
MSDSKTPLLDDLEKGPWPSFVSDLKQLSKKEPVVSQLLGQMEQSYKDRWNYWQGTVINLKGYGGGVIARYSELQSKFPDIAEFHTIRVIPPPGWVYSTKTLRELCDISEKYSAGILQLHGMTGDALLLGSNTEKTHEAGEELMEKGWDIGGSGGALRTLACCVGMARCEMSCYDTMKTLKHLTDTFISQLHRPEFPYKFKFKLSGCANDCAASVQRSDMPIIGTWRGPMRIDQAEVGKFVDAHGADFVVENVISRYPTASVYYRGLCALSIKSAKQYLGAVENLEAGHPAARLGPDKALRMARTYNTFICSILANSARWTLENGYRTGEFIDRVGLGTFLQGVGIEPDPQMVIHPRANSYIKFEELAPGKMAGEPKKTPSVMDKEIETREAAV